MQKKISVNLTADANAVITRIKAAAVQNGIHLEGDALSGQFNGKGMKGSYEIHNATMIITISKKPLLMPWSLIESSVVDFFACRS